MKTLPELQPGPPPDADLYLNAWYFDLPTGAAFRAPADGGDPAPVTTHTVPPVDERVSFAVRPMQVVMSTEADGVSRKVWVRAADLATWERVG